MDIKKMGTIAYMIIMVFYGVYSMILSIQAYSKFTNTSSTYQNMANNYKESFIIDIQTSLNACSDGYTSLFLWNWGGTSVGCDCTTSSYTSSYQSVYSQTCNSTQTINGCSTISSIPSQNFQFIKGISGGSPAPMSVCVKRSATPFYKLAKEQVGVCSASQKTCGNPFNKETIICVGLTENCPYYDFKYSATQDQTTYPPISWDEITLSQGYLYASKGLTATKLPNSEIRFTQAGVCEDDNTAKVLPQGDSDYTLLESTRYSCSSLDSTFSAFGFTTSESDYYKMNLSAANYNKLSTLPGFSFSSQPYQSFQRSFINWKTSDRDKLFDFVDSADSTSKLKTVQLVLMVINIFVCMMVSIILQIFEVYYLIGKDLPCIDEDLEEQKKKILKIKKIINYGSKVIQLPFQLWAFIVSAMRISILLEISYLHPSEASFNAEIESFATQLESNVFKKNLTAIIVLGSTVLLDIIMFCFEKCCLKKFTDKAAVMPVSNEENSVFKSTQPNIQMANPTPNGITNSSIQQKPIAQLQGVFEKPQPQGVNIQQQPEIMKQQEPGIVEKQLEKIIKQPEMVLQQLKKEVQQSGMVVQQQRIMFAQGPAIFVEPTDMYGQPLKIVLPDQTQGYQQIINQ